jgi:hypothetical protein
MIMKKVFIIATAAMALTLASCGNKNTSEAPAEQTELSAADAELENATAELAAQIETGDASKLQAAVESAKVKVAQLLKDNPEAAKEYLTKVQDYLKENADKIKTIVGDNAAVQTAVAALADMPAETIISTLQAQLDAAGQTGQEAVDAMQAAGEDAIDAAKNAAQEQVDQAKEEAQKAVNNAAEEAKKKANEQVDKAADKALKQLGL